MPRGSRPVDPKDVVRSMPAVDGRPQAVQIPPLSPQPVAVPLGARDGPLGFRRTKPEIVAQIQKIMQEMRDSNAPGGAIPVVAPMPAPSQEPAQPQGPAPSMDPAQSMPVIKAQPVPAVQQLPKAPPIQLTAEAPPPAQVETKTGDSQPPPVSSRDTPQAAVAQSGTESRLFGGMTHDQDFVNSVLWKSSPERRKIIEGRCGPIDWDSLITSYEIRQEVVVWLRPKEIRVTYRTMTADDEYLVRRILHEEYMRSGAEFEIGSVITAVAGGVVAINDQVLPIIPPVHTSKLEDRLAVMRERIKYVLRMPYPLLTDLAINYSWFVMRVTEAQRRGDLGNG